MCVRRGATEAQSGGHAVTHGIRQPRVHGWPPNEEQTGGEGACTAHVKHGNPAKLRNDRDGQVRDAGLELGRVSGIGCVAVDTANVSAHATCFTHDSVQLTGFCVHVNPFLSNPIP